MNTSETIQKFLDQRAHGLLTEGEMLDAISTAIDQHDRADVLGLVSRDERGEPLDDECSMCAPFGCDDPDAHLGVPSRYTPAKNRGCRCGSDSHGGDCMCFENDY